MTHGFQWLLCFILFSLDVSIETWSLFTRVSNGRLFYFKYLTLRMTVYNCFFETPSETALKMFVIFCKPITAFGVIFNLVTYRRTFERELRLWVFSLCFVFNEYIISYNGYCFTVGWLVVSVLALYRYTFPTGTKVVLESCYSICKDFNFPFQSSTRCSYPTSDTILNRLPWQLLCTPVRVCASLSALPWCSDSLESALSRSFIYVSPATPIDCALYIELSCNDSLTFFFLPLPAKHAKRKKNYRIEIILTKWNLFFKLIHVKRMIEHLFSWKQNRPIHQFMYGHVYGWVNQFQFDGMLMSN